MDEEIEKLTLQLAADRFTHKPSSYRNVCRFCPTVMRFRCRVCGKITAGRLSRRHGRFPSDTTFYFPRRHNVNGKQCEGSLREAKEIDIGTIRRKRCTGCRR